MLHDITHAILLRTVTEIACPVKAVQQPGEPMHRRPDRKHWVAPNGKSCKSFKPIDCDDAIALREAHDAAHLWVSGEDVSREADLSEITLNNDLSATTSGDSLSNDGAGDAAYIDNATQAGTRTYFVACKWCFSMMDRGICSQGYKGSIVLCIAVPGSIKASFKHSLYKT